jgi:hypothetical protein
MSFGSGGFAQQPFAGYASGSSFTGVATLPMMTGAGAAVVQVKGAAVASLPMLTGAGSAIVQVHEVGIATMPMLTAVGAVTIPALVHGDATLPFLTADAHVNTGTRRGLHSWQKCPRPASGFIERGGGDLRRGKPEPV